MISESHEEQACLYVFGLLPEREIPAFEAEISRSDELAGLVASLNNATVALANSAPETGLPPEARIRLLDAVSRTAGNVIAMPRGGAVRFIPWAAAACLAGLLFWQSESANREKATMRESITIRENDLAIAAEKQALLEKIAADNQRRSGEQLAAADAARADLVKRLATLEQKDFLAQAKIAVMGSLLKDRPQAVAVSLWDQENQKGVLVVENLPVLDPAKDYQLWIIDPSIAAPVSAGVFKVDAQGRVRITFKPTQTIASAAKFAVTEEREGGVLSPTMDKMVVIGGS